MDTLSASLHAFLICLGAHPEAVPPEAAHHAEHLLHLLPPADERLLLGFYGLFGTPRQPVQAISAARSMPPADVLARVVSCLRRLAVTPEWQVIMDEELLNGGRA